MAQKHQKELGGARQMSMGTKIVVGIFAVIMALSMMLPSLTAIFASDESQGGDEPDSEQVDETTDEKTSDEATDEDAEASAGDEKDASDESGEKDDDSAKKDDSKKKSPATAEVPDNDTLKSLADQYQDKIATYDERLADDPQNLAALLNKAQTYMNWGYSAINSSSSDEERAYAEDLVQAAIDSFDAYLVVRESVAVRVDQALCQYYLGNDDKAVKALEGIAKKNEDNPLVWANLGMLYEARYETDKASEAYQKATETDPNDEYGAYSYASQRLISLNSKVSSPSDAGEASLDDVTTKTSTGLTSTLVNDSGVGF